jgi:hypothetical protein
MLICYERKTLLNGWLILADKIKRVLTRFKVQYRGSAGASPSFNFTQGLVDDGSGWKNLQTNARFLTVAQLPVQVRLREGPAGGAISIQAEPAHAARPGRAAATADRSRAQLSLYSIGARHLTR